MSLLSLAMLLGTALPLLVAIVQQEKWPSQVRAIVALVLVVIAAAATTWGKGYWHGWQQASIDAFLTVLAGMVVTTWGSYHALWSQLGATQWIEKVTTFTRAHQSVADQVIAQLATADPADVARVVAAFGAARPSATPAPSVSTVQVPPAPAAAPPAAPAVQSLP
jgi:hypothetical protein